MTIVLRHDTPPPSVNSAWKPTKFGGLRASKELVSWKKAAGYSFRHAKDYLPSSCFWSTRIFMPAHSRIDLDNCNKAIHDAIVEAKIAPDDFYLVDSRASYWAGKYLIIHLTEEPIEKWAAILKTSPAIIRRMRAAKQSAASPHLV